MSGKIEMSLELAENLLHCGRTSSCITPAMTEELRAILAAPVVEPVACFKGAHAASYQSEQQSDGPLSELAVLRQTCAQLEKFRDQVIADRIKHEPVAYEVDEILFQSKADAELYAKYSGEVVPLYRHPAEPPAPVAVDERAEFENYYRDRIMGNRTGVRFLRSASGSYLDREVLEMWSGWQARACLDKVKELNQ